MQSQQPIISGNGNAAAIQMDVVIYKMVGEVSHIKAPGIEPGVELAQGLSTIIDHTIKDSVRLGWDLSLVSQGILIGAFRAHSSIPLESHKTIRLLLHEVLQAVFNHKADLPKAIQGLLSGIAAVAKEHKLNEGEALIIAKEDMLLSANTIDSSFGDSVKAIVSSGH